MMNSSLQVRGSVTLNVILTGEAANRVTAEENG